jgi:hypothetical protein
MDDFMILNHQNMYNSIHNNPEVQVIMNLQQL